MSVAIAAIAAAALVTGCSSGASTDSGSASNADCEKVFTIGFSHPAGDVAAVKTVKEAAAAQAEEVGCVDLLLDNTVAMNLDTQRSTLESWVTQKVDAIVVWPVDPAAVENLREQAQAQGTKWLTYAAPNEKEDGGVGFDNVAAGKEMTAFMKEWIAEKYPDGGITAVVTTATSLPAVQPRVLPIIDALKELGIEIVSQQDCVVQDCGLQIAEDAMNAHPDMRIFVGLNDDAGLGGFRALKNAGVNLDEYFVVGFDGPEEALVALKDKSGYTASSAIPLIDLGASVVDNSLAAITGEGDPSKLTPMMLVTPEDTDLLDELLNAFKK